VNEINRCHLIQIGIERPSRKFNNRMEEVIDENMMAWVSAKNGDKEYK
jgi:hypothetical protein